MRYYVNLHKGGMFFYVLALMLYYDNFTTGAYLYLTMHGSYGMFWILKDMVFPDPGFYAPVSLGSFLMPFPVALIPYMLPAYWMISSFTQVSNERMFACLMIYMVGLILVMLTDAQKYLVLRERKGLITHCMMGWSRNMNYVGEILLYAAIGLLVQRWETWMIFSYMWGVVFVVRMLVKDYSLSKKEGWPEYYHKTWFLVPKLNNSALFSAIVYSLALAAGYVLVTNGFERTLKQLFLE